MLLASTVPYRGKGIRLQKGPVTAQPKSSGLVDWCRRSWEIQSASRVAAWWFETSYAEAVRNRVQAIRPARLDSGRPDSRDESMSLDEHSDSQSGIEPTIGAEPSADAATRLKISATPNAESEPATVDAEYLCKLCADVVRSGRKISSQAKKSQWIPVPDHLIRRHDCRVVSVRMKVGSLLLSGKWKSPSTKDLTQTIEGQDELVARVIIERGASNPAFRKLQGEADRLHQEYEQLEDVPSDEELLLAACPDSCCAA